MAFDAGGGATPRRCDIRHRQRWHHGALTDGLLVLRHQFGFAGQALDQVPDSVGPTN
ncbi:MAG: hypothetical protein VB915_01550 [Pseudomonadales bacterium]|nr:hypothetical protein [Pseudomonadales bacterium]